MPFFCRSLSTRRWGRLFLGRDVATITLNCRSCCHTSGHLFLRLTSCCHSVLLVCAVCYCCDLHGPTCLSTKTRTVSPWAPHNTPTSVIVGILCVLCLRGTIFSVCSCMFPCLQTKASNPMHGAPWLGCLDLQLVVKACVLSSVTVFAQA